jgi:peptidoglycan hydrolase-like protein with peptidoglycan-binding domain
VLALQQLLQCFGYFPVDIEPNGNYGPATTEAVSLFQQANAQPGTGEMTEDTLTALNGYVRRPLPSIPVIDLPTVPGEGEEECGPDCANLTYDLYIINPTGSERHLGTDFVRTESLGGGKLLHRFEDKGADFDYNDVLVEVDLSDCRDIKVRVVEHNALWRHQIRLAAYYRGELLSDQLVHGDSAVAAQLNATGSAANPDVPTVCAESACGPDCANLTYDLYIINPTGSERHLGTDFVRTESLGGGKLLHRFEDKGADFDYNDVLVEVDLSDCRDIKVRVVEHNALWRHQIRLAAYYRGELLSDQLVHGDSAVAAQLNATGSAANPDIPNRCALAEAGESAATDDSAAVAPNVPTAASSCQSALPFETYLDTDSEPSETIRELQGLLQCLGYFPAAITPTALYGTITEEAVTAFQVANGVDPVGYVGPQTRAALNQYVTAP